MRDSAGFTPASPGSRHTVTASRFHNGFVGLVTCVAATAATFHGPTPVIVVSIPMLCYKHRANAERASRVTGVCVDTGQFIGLVAAAVAASTIGSMLGLGGGVFLVPMFTLFFDIDPKVAVAASAICVVTNSVVGSSVHIRSGFTNLRLAMLLQVTTATGAIVGALIALEVGATLINVMLGVVLLYAAISMLRQRRIAPAPPDESAPDPHRLRESYRDAATGTIVTYQPEKLAAGMAISGGAGVLSGMLGIGGGVINVPVMNLLMKIPVKAAAGTGSFMVGMTAVATAAVFWAHDQVNPNVVVPAMIGVFLGGQFGSRVTRRVHTDRLVILFVVVIAYLGISVLLKAAGVGF